MKWSNHLLLVVIFGISLQTCAQVSEQLNANSGLPENTGQCLLQDAQGYIWIGTQNGLARYDGQSFKVLKEADGLSSNQIEKLYLIDDHKLLIGTRNGLDLYDTYTETLLHFIPDTQQSYEANWFCSLGAKGDTIYASTFYGLHILTQDLKPLSFFPNQNQSERLWTSVYKDPNSNELWYLSNGQLYLVQNNFLKPVLDTEKRVLSLLSLGDSLLLGTEEKLLIYNKAATAISPCSWCPEDLSFILDMKKGGHEELWFATRNGAYSYQDGNWQWYHSKATGENKISHSLVLSILEDHQGQVWLGTGQGINLIDPRKRKFQRWSELFKGPKYASFKNIEVLFYDQNHQLWVGASDGLQCYKRNDLGHWQAIPLAPPLRERSFNIDFITQASDGSMYIGTSRGALYRGNKDSWELLYNGDDHKQLRGICFAQDKGALWLGYSDGLLYWTEENGIVPLKGLPKIPVVQMEILEGELWIGSAKGLFRIDTSNLAWKQYQAGPKGAIPNSLVTDFSFDGKSYWFSSFGGGIYQYHPAKNTFKVIGESEGLVNANVWSLYFDSLGRLWSSTDGGISFYDTTNGDFHSFNSRDGLNFDDFSMNAHCQDSAHRYYFGNPEGITVFDPLAVFPDTSVALPSLREVWVDYEASPQHLSQALSTGRLEMRPTYTSLDLFFSGFNFRDPQLEWEFKLDDAAWRSFEGGRLSLGRPSPGSYKLQIRNRNKDGFSAPKPYLIEWLVIPAFYETWWFRIGLFLSLILLSAGLIFIYNRRQFLKRIQQLETEQKVHQERERISQDLHDHVGAHLSRIASDLDLMELKLKKQVVWEEGLDQLVDTRNYTSETIRLLRDTIWAIDKDDYSIEQFAEKIEAFLEQYLADYLPWTFKKDLSFKRSLSSREALNLLRILQEATQNMLKYSQANNFQVKLYGREALNLEIKDDGLGFQDLGLETESYGLKNMKARATEIGAEYEIDSTNGVKIIVRLEAD
jgi:signal transduction histidine kinase/ligand-binding sensor domain-containing protein